jgi:hypothetical protein
VVSPTSCLSWLQTVILPISGSHVARTVDLNHYSKLFPYKFLLVFWCLAFSIQLILVSVMFGAHMLESLPPSHWASQALLSHVCYMVPDLMTLLLFCF